MSEYNKPPQERDLVKLSIEDYALDVARRNVIGAAKALRVAERLNEPARYFAVHEVKQVFNKAVEALLAAEGGGK